MLKSKAIVAMTLFAAPTLSDNCRSCTLFSPLCLVASFVFNISYFVYC